MKLPKEEDPFWEPAEDTLIGTANVFLQSLGFALDFDDKITITDFKVRLSFLLPPSPSSLSWLSNQDIVCKKICL